ncbi:MAG TPA: hypothetical protein DDZ80_20925 [Cyanobacteria bacterium UBA8803]|nr:hypothetical protein [Cyanobacteria bacterium UBA9273]HBL60809.1 hypothetical protein [Cyanobacteria bacterium UBA8803]
MYWTGTDTSRFFSESCNRPCHSSLRDARYLQSTVQC